MSPFPSLADRPLVESLGNPGWDWDGLQPYYKKVRIRALSLIPILTSSQATELAKVDDDIQAKYNYSYDLAAYGGPQSPAKVSFPEFQYPDMCKSSLLLPYMDSS